MAEKLLVVKIGGGEGIDAVEACRDAAALISAGTRLIIVHGGSARVTQLSKQMGHTPRFLHSSSGHISRYTDLFTRDIFVRAAGEINREIVHALSRGGIQAVGLPEPQSCVLLGNRNLTLRAVSEGRERVIRDDYSGRIRSVDSGTLWQLLERGSTPVVPPLVWDPDDGFLNVDGDRASAAIAVALEAEALVMLSNVAGLLARFPDESSLIERVPRAQLAPALDSAQGRMKRKILSAREALERGVKRVIVADGRISEPITQALAGGGTWFE